MRTKARSRGKSDGSKYQLVSDSLRYRDILALFLLLSERAFKVAVLTGAFAVCYFTASTIAWNAPLTPLVIHKPLDERVFVAFVNGDVTNIGA